MHDRLQRRRLRDWRLRDRLLRLRLLRQCLLRGLGDDRGAVTAEYAIVIMAAVAFAGALVAVMRSGAVQGLLTDLVHKALTIG